MTKYFKYIAIGFSILCILVVVVCIIPKNPFSDISSEKINITDDINSYISDNNLNEYEFTNYEKKIIYDFGLNENISKGREFIYTFNNNMIYMPGNLHYCYQSDDKDNMDVYHFIDSNYVLIKSRISYEEYLTHTSCIRIETTSDYEVVDSCSTYTFNDIEYSLDELHCMSGNPYDDSHLYYYSQKPSVSPKYTQFYNRPDVTLSLFIKLDENIEYTSIFIQEIKEVVENSNNLSISIGLNKIKDITGAGSSSYYEYKTEIIEIGGN